MEPIDPYERAKSVAIYYTALLRRATQEFNSVRDEILSLVKANMRCTSVTDPAPCGPVEAEHRLEMLRARVAECRVHLHEATAELQWYKPEYIRRRETSNARNKADNDILATTVRNIQI